MLRTIALTITSIVTVVSLSSSIPPALQYDIAKTPPMGWSSWNSYACSVNDTLMRDAAQQIVHLGLASAGYLYTNIDDCWMLRDRDTNGNQVPNPEKFPDGINSTIAYVHSLGLKFGIYSSASNYTCAGYAASCGYESIDSSNYANWGVDYVKEDACGGCRPTKLEDYEVMQKAIWATGRTMVLSVEGVPPIQNCSAGGAGNMRRVGHDITSMWKSMTSLVDIASGLWTYAHNSTNPQFGGFFNDLDMMEIGNGQFTGANNPLSIAHMTMWAIMKAPMILGFDPLTVDNGSISIVMNSEAIAVNQDPLGVQAHRVAVYSPVNNTIIDNQLDSVAVLAPCSSQKPSQQWRFVNHTSPNRNLLYLVPCSSADPYQQWNFPGASGSAPSLLTNIGVNLCVDAAAQYDPGMLLTCNSSSPSQQWMRQTSSAHVLSTNPAHCLDVYMFSGPDVEMGSCKTPGDNDSNQMWTFDASTGLIYSNSTGATGMCLSASGGPSGGQLVTTDDAGNQWCLDGGWNSEGGWSGSVCNSSPGGGGRGQLFDITKNDATTVNIAGNPAPLFNNDFGASGPLPHTRYIMGYGWEGMTTSTWIADYAALSSNGTSAIQANSQSIIDDDLVGHVTTGGNFCLDITTMGMLEVWAGPLTNGRIAVALFNRSPADDTITAYWNVIGAPSSSTSYAVRDIWQAKDMGIFQTSYSTMVPAHSTAFLVLTPQ